MRPVLPLAVLLAACSLARAEMPLPAGPTFSVLKIVRGDEITFAALPAGDVEAEKKRLSKEAREALAAWEAQKAEFSAQEENRDKAFLEPRPDPVAVSVAKDRIPGEEEARKLAGELQRKAEGKYAVIRIAGMDRSVTFEVVRENRIKARETELKRGYEAAKAAWQEQADAYQVAVVRNKAEGFGTSPFTNPKPVEPKLSRARDGIETLEQASKACEDLEKQEKPGRR